MDVLENQQNQAIEEAKKRIEMQDFDDPERVKLGFLLSPSVSYKKTDNKPGEDGNEAEESSLLPNSSTQTDSPKQREASHDSTEFDEVDAFFKSTKTETVYTRKIENDNGNKAVEERKETKYTKECCTDNCLKYFLLALLIVVIGMVVIVVVVVVVTQQNQSKPPTETGMDMLQETTLLGMQYFSEICLHFLRN